MKKTGDEKSHDNVPLTAISTTVVTIHERTVQFA
jgi:hypothetical protein